MCGGSGIAGWRVQPHQKNKTDKTTRPNGFLLSSVVVDK